MGKSDRVSGPEDKVLVLKIVRVVGFSLAVVAAVLVFALLGPDSAARYRPISVEGNAQLIEGALAEYEANAVNAADDLQLQSVVNGWVARDMLFILANELDSLSAQISILSAQTDGLAVASDADDRVPALLLVAVVTFAFHAATLPHVLSPSPAAGAGPSGRRQHHDYDDDDDDERDDLDSDDDEWLEDDDDDGYE